jgi:beta-galactosidase
MRALEAALSRRTRSGMAAILLLAVSASVRAEDASRPEPIFPMAVWYGGGKARAPMLEADPRAKKEEWRRPRQSSASTCARAGLWCWRRARAGTTRAAAPRP